MEECSVKYALRILNGKWKLQIVWVLTSENTVRFNELQRRLDGISSLMLSRNLQELERDKIVNRHQYNEIPPRVEYSLSELGKTLEPALLELGDWGTKAFNIANQTEEKH